MDDRRLLGEDSNPFPLSFEGEGELKEETSMRVREAILHSERQPEGAVTVARVVSIGKGKRVIQIVQTKGNQASTVGSLIKERK